MDILVAQSNSGYHTYDGIETGGERLCREVEEELAAVRARGGRIAKLSVVGYSMGGLVARYALGLLHARGVLDELECMNFTAFASPFLGARAARRGRLGALWNTVAPRTLSLSGRQMFLLDEFRDSHRPVLAVLADPDSIFMAALARFRRRSLYANIANDRSAVYYTTAISKTDPFADLARVRVRYVDGYEDVVLDPARPRHPPVGAGDENALSAVPPRTLLNRLQWAMAFAFLVPIALSAFLVNTGIQTVRSHHRIRRHANGLDGHDTAQYRVPLWMTKVQGAVEDAYESLNASQPQQLLSAAPSSAEESDADPSAAAQKKPKGEKRKLLDRERRESNPSQPTLALTPRPVRHDPRPRRPRLAQVPRLDPQAPPQPRPPSSSA